MLIRQCCKCGEVLGRVDDGLRKVAITHTYCSICFEIEMAEIDLFFLNLPTDNSNEVLHA